MFQLVVFCLFYLFVFLSSLIVDKLLETNF